jgi:hypothetical protein
VEGVDLLGPVDNPVDIYGKCMFMVNPVQGGTGLKIKTVEALSFGRCVVTSPSGLEGLEEMGGQSIVVAHTERESSDTIVNFLQNPERTMAAGRDAMAIVQQLNHRNRASLRSVFEAIS